MTDGKDTKPLTTVIETTPESPPQEGEPMPLTLELLDMRIKIIEVEITALKEWRTTLLTREQIVEIVKDTNAASVKRVEELVDGVMKRFGQIEFDAGKVQAMHETMQNLVRANSEQKQSYDFIQRALSSLLGYDISQPHAPRIGLSIFETIKQTDETAEKAANDVETVREEMAQVRLDAVQTLTIAKQITDYHAKNEAVLTAITENAKRWKSVQDAIEKVVSNPRILIPALGALGSGGIAAAKLIEVLF